VSVYDQDPGTGLIRRKARPDTDYQVTALREKATRARYNSLYIRNLLRERQPALSAALELAVRVS